MAALQNNDRYIGELLVKDGIISREDLDHGLQEQKKGRDFLCSTLVHLGFASEEKIFSILSLQIGVPFLKLDEQSPDPDLLNKIPGSLALGCKFMPLKTEQETLYLASSDPLNTESIEEIKNYLGFERAKVFLVGDADLRSAIHKYYGI